MSNAIVYQVIGDQPMTCPKCGARTKWEDVRTGPWDTIPAQQHTCLGCGNVFLACEDDDD